MKQQPFCSFSLASVSLTDYGLQIPSPFCSLNLSAAEIDAATNWTLSVIVGGNSDLKMNVAAFEALLYSASQAAAGYENSAGIPVAFIFGWLDDDGNVQEYLSYQGWSVNFKVTAKGQFMNYVLTGYASLAVEMSAPVFNIPAVSGIVQPSAIVEALAKATKANDYYNLDIDHNDAPTLVSHGPMTTGFNSYVKGSYSGEDNYSDFPGLIKLSKSFNATRDSAGLKNGVRKLSSLMNNLTSTNVSNYLKMSLVDNTPQCGSFSYWVDEPTMTNMGTIHYKSDAGLTTNHSADTLEYGTPTTNIMSLEGSYNGVAYNMTDMSFSSLGFQVDGSGNTILEDAKVVNSWSASLADVYQTSSIINDVNALATQFSGSFQVTLKGTCKQYQVAQSVSMIVMHGNTISPMSGVYSIVSVSHTINATFVTVLKLTRLVMSSANQTALATGITIANSPTGRTSNSYNTTSNIKSPNKVDFGNSVYPTFADLVSTSKTFRL